MIMDQDPASVSEYSMDFSLFFRVNMLFYRADQSAIDLNAYSWFNILMAIFREIHPIIKDQDLPLFESKMEELLIQFINIKQSISETGSYQISLELYKKLQEFDTMCRGAMQSIHMYAKMKQDNSYGFSK